MKTFFRPALLAAILALAGCASFDDPGLDDDLVSDDAIASFALSRLNNDAMVARATLTVTVQDGLATLFGSVPDEATRMRAIQILEGTPGIFDVLDRTRKR